MRPILLCSFLLISSLLSPSAAMGQNSQSYLNDTGSTAYGINIPVENGFINVSNGNLHLEFPLASPPQRGALSVNERLVYDSRIWMFSPFGTHGSYHWWPYNIPGSNSSTNSGGWRLVTGGEIGSIGYSVISSNQYECPGEPDQGLWVNSSSATPIWTDPNGTSHPFDSVLYQEDTTGCPNGAFTQSITSGSATDGSGYSMRDDGTGNPLIVSSDGTQVYPSIIDRYGNYLWNDANGNLIDDTGRVPVIVTQNGNVTYYDVLAPNGPINNNGTRVRYTVTSASVPVATNFQQSDVYEWNPSIQYLTPVQSISLPDGSQYSFTYDGYGGLASVTLPTGGVIQYGYSNFVDSSNTANRWLTSRTQGNNPQMTITPSVVTTCPNYSTGCVESVNLHKPSGDETVYRLTLINGAWNTGVTTYTGPAASGQTLTNATSVNQYTNGCSNAYTCVGGNYLTQSLSTTVLYANGSPSVFTQTQALYSGVGKPSAVKEWDYGANFGGTPTRETDYSYTGLDVQQVTVLSNGSQAGQTTYGYTSNATTTSGVAQHATQNAGGPYLQTVSHWLNTGNPSITTYTMDDTGQVVSTRDPNQNPSTNFSYQCANSLPYQTTTALNQTTTYGYDCNSGAITSVRDPNDMAAGRSGTTYFYEGTAGRLQSVNLPDGGQTSYGYPSSIEVDTTVLATPSPSISSQDIADSFGRKYQHIQAGVSSETTYDANGRIACVANPHFTNSSSSTDGSTCITSYDGLDRPLAQQQPDGNTLQWSYSGNSTTSKDEAGNQWVRTSNAFGLLTNVVEPTGASTNYTYDGLGNLSTVNQLGVSGETPRGRISVYDSLSRLTNACNPESIPNSSSCSTNGPWSDVYGYDANGNMTNKTDARGITGTSVYDALNRATSVTYSDGSPQKRFAYDQSSYATFNFQNPIGRLTFQTVGPGNSTQLFSYDSMGRVINEYLCTPSNCGTGAYTVSSGYDLAGNMTSLTYPDGRVVTQGVDAGGHLQNLTFDNWNGQHVGSTYASNFTYTPAGAQAEVILGNVVYIHTPYNNRQQMCQVWSNGGQGWIDTHIYYGSPIFCNSTPGNNGNITQIKDWKNANRTRTFGYDPLNRITSFYNGAPSNSNDYMAQNYSYDSFGNLQQSGTLNFQQGFNSNNQISTGGYGYDAAGNLTSFNDSMSHISYVYNADNQLTNFASGLATYTYDANGQRIRKDTGGSWTEYVYFNGQTLAEKNSDGTWSDYIYANGQKIARADSFNRYIRFTGNLANVGDYGEMNLTPAAPLSVPIRGGDKLVWKQRQSVAYGGVYFVTQQGTWSVWNLRDQNQEYTNDSMQTDGNWHLRIADLSDYAGQTISAVEFAAEGNSPPGNFVLDFADIAVVSADGTVQPVYNGAAAVTGSAWGTGGYTQGAIGVQSIPSATGDTTYYIGDQIGSTRLTMAAEGWPMSSSTFYPFGQEQNPTADPNHYKFTGQERDAESGLDHAMFRQYSSSSGRWMSPDPYYGSYDLSNPQSFNRYSYVLNNPLRYVDPLGLILCDYGSSDQGGEDFEDDLEGAADCIAGGGTVVTAQQSVTVTPGGSSGVTIITNVPLGTMVSGGANKNSYWSCVRGDLDGLSLQSGLQKISGGRLGTSWLAGAFLGNSVQSVGDTIAALSQGNIGGAANAAGSETFGDTAGSIATKSASYVPNVAITVGVQAASSSGRFSLTAGASLPFGSLANVGASLLSDGLETLGAFKLPYDLTVASFSAVACGIGR